LYHAELDHLSRLGFHISYDKIFRSLYTRGHIDNMVMSANIELFNLENEHELTLKCCFNFSFSPNFTIRRKTSIHGHLTSIHFFISSWEFDCVFVFKKLGQIENE
jgi:hypothetical protein